MRSTPLTWTATAGATIASTYALDALATACGVALAATGVPQAAGRGAVLVLLVASYVAWGAGLRVSLAANWDLLCRTGACTNVLSKAAFAATARCREPWRRRAASAGYVVTELVKEAPYYAGAFGSLLVSDSVTADDALVFLAGANLGAAAYELGLARATRALLRRRPG
ncbi:MAG TPA: hypothetical protein VD836_04335 [Solirubrobacteraceae bacterium]|nr:hypothetical protein [Solirubrobacteraceae bacterium]